MQTFSAQMTPWFASYGIIVCALYFLPGESSFRKVAFAAQTQAPSPQGAAGDHASPACPLPGSLPGPLPPAVDAPYCVYTIAAGDTLDRIATQYGTTPDTLLRANRKTRVRGKKPVTNRNVLPAGALLLIPTTSLSLAAPAEDPSFPHQTVTPESSLTPPVSEAPSVPSNAQAPVVSTEEKIVHERADPREGQTAIQADREQHARDIAAIKSGLEQLTKRITGLHNEFEKKQSDTSLAKTVALAVAGVCILAIIGAFQFGVSLSRPSQPTPSLETAGHGMLPQMAPPKTFLEESVSMDIRIATGYLSRPKGEDVIMTAEEDHFSAMVVADGSSSVEWNGREISGGGREAAQIAARTALTYLTGHLLPGMGIEEMVAILQGCFRQARTALEKHNASTTTPGGTTLLIALLCQGGDGLWYWLYGNLGNGVLTLLHTQPLFARWPIHTPLLSNHANGVTTISLPGYATQGYLPSVGVRPHSPGDMLVIGSDGLDHLNSVTMKCDRLYFLNFLWTQIQQGRSCLDSCLQALPTGRTDAPWQNALDLDDTTIGILWA